MTQMTSPPVFDGHNDVLLRLYRKQGSDGAADFLDGDGLGHLDLPRMKQGGFCGGMFAIFVPSPPDNAERYAMMEQAPYDVPLPAAMSADEAAPVALAMADLLFDIEARSSGQVKVCRTSGDIRECVASGTLAVVMHIEGAEAIDREFKALEAFYQTGLRSLGPVWSRPNIFGQGVPFRFPASPDTGDGLSDLGRELVKNCNALGITIDLSHLNEKGFWDVARLSTAPLIATHSNAHALCPHARNLTDAQLAAIAESNGMVGVNFATGFIRADGRMDTNTSLDLMLAHVDYLIEHLGEDRVGFGSDFDGAKIPKAIGTVAGLPALRKAMADHGYNDELMAKLCYQNWLNALERTWV